MVSQHLALEIARKGWNGKKQYIQLATGISYKTADGEIVNCEHDTIGNMAIAFVGTSGVQMGWLASQADMLAEDWVFAKTGRLSMKKAMLSQPMAGKTDEEIIATREKAIKVLEEKGYEVVNTLFTDEWYSNESMKERGVVQIPLCFLAKSLENMSLCHAAYFCKGWENARGCKIEHDAAVAYGLDIIYEEA